MFALIDTPATLVLQFPTSKHQDDVGIGKRRRKVDIAAI